MSENFVYRCTRLDGTGKQGILTPDDNGFYTICVGALDHASKNVDQRGQPTYYSSHGAERFFAPGTMFNNRIQGGFVKCEYGHPEREPGMNDMQFLERNLAIREKNVCAVIGAIWLVRDYIDPLTGEKCIGIMAKIKPTGPYGKYLEDDLRSKGMNVCFSIRSLTSWKTINGRKCKVLHTVITFDYVNEPGITCAEKLVSPSLESSVPDVKALGIEAEVGMDVMVSNHSINQLLNKSATGVLSLESNSREMLVEAKSNLEGLERKERKISKAFSF